MRLMAVLPAMKLSDVCAYGYDEECDLTSKANQKIGGNGSGGSGGSRGRGRSRALSSPTVNQEITGRPLMKTTSLERFTSATLEQRR